MKRPNLTCASPCLYRSRYQNFDHSNEWKWGCLPGQPSNGLWRRGQVTIPRGVACRPDGCTNLRPLGEVWVLPLKGPRQWGYGYHCWSDRVRGVVTWRKRHTDHTGEVPRRSQVYEIRPAYKFRAKWQAYAAQWIRPPPSRPP